MRTEYDGQAEVPEGIEPWRLLEAWIEEARTAGNPEPEAMCLATVGGKWPSARFVLLRGLDAGGLRFFTHLYSPKVQDIEANARAAVCFWWPELHRQVRAVGRVVPLADDESDAYFASRPLESRFSAYVSPQSVEITSLELLEKHIARAKAKYPDGPPRPTHWGGLVVQPVKWEFWIGRPRRLHERHQFVKKKKGGWQRDLLAP